MNLSKKVIIIIAAVLVLLIGGGIAFATNTPKVRAERQLNLGNKYLQEGKYQEAILAFQKVIEIEPKNIPARLGLGKVYVATNEYDKAETVLKEVIEIDPNNQQAREDIFEVYLKENKLDEANSILQELIKINPQLDVKQYNSEIDTAKVINASKASYDQGIKQMYDKQYLPAVDSFQKVIKEDTERYDDAQTKITDCRKAFVDETLQKAKDAAANKDYQTALDFVNQILKINPDNQEALKLRKEYQEKLKNFKVELLNYSQIWIEYTGGKRELLLDSRVDEHSLNINDAQASIDGTGVYYTTDAGVMSSCNVHFINITTKEIKKVCYGMLIGVISEGEYAGKLIVLKHLYYGPPNYGSYDEKYIVDNNGNDIRKVSDEELKKFKLNGQ